MVKQLEDIHFDNLKYIYNDLNIFFFIKRNSETCSSHFARFPGPFSEKNPEYFRKLVWIVLGRCNRYIFLMNLLPKFVRVTPAYVWKT